MQAARAQETRVAAFRRLPQTGQQGMPQGELARELGVPAQTLFFQAGEPYHVATASQNSAKPSEAARG